MDKIKKDKVVFLIVMVGIILNLYYCISNNLIVDAETLISRFFLTILPFIMYLYMLYLTNFDNGDKFKFFRILLILGFTLIVNYSLARASYDTVYKIIAIIFCLSICFSGSYLMKLPPDSEYGFKTPWTKNKLVLYKTNQFAGRLFNFVGVISIFSVVYIGIPFVFGLILVSLAWSFYYSYKRNNTNSL